MDVGVRCTFVYVSKIHIFRNSVSIYNFLFDRFFECGNLYFLRELCRRRRVHKYVNVFCSASTGNSTIRFFFACCCSYSHSFVNKENCPCERVWMNARTNKNERSGARIRGRRTRQPTAWNECENFKRINLQLEVVYETFALPFVHPPARVDCMCLCMAQANLGMHE